MFDDDKEIKEGEIPEGFHEEVVEGADLPHDDVDPLDEESDQKKDTDHGYFGDDKDYEKLILDPYDDNPEYS